MGTIAAMPEFSTETDHGSELCTLRVTGVGAVLAIERAPARSGGE